MEVFRRALQRMRGRRVDKAEYLLSGPIQGDLLGTEHLAERARDLAREQRLALPDRFRYRARLLERLDSTTRVLDNAYTTIARETGNGKQADPSAEWLLDNYHVIQEHIDEVRSSLPGGYYRELPVLSNGTLAGYPRIYEVAIALISHSEGRVDLDNVDLFVEAFQQVEALRIGELWAIPAMLRLALIENIRRMTLRTLKRLEELARADRWVERVERGAGLEGEHLTRTLRTMLASQQRLTPTFVARFLSGLRQVSGASPALMGVERWLQHEELDPDDSLARATQRLVHTQLTMANSITSLRAIGQRDWRSFVERQSAMEAVLGTDPAGAYHRMTFATRDRYRHVVELLARQSGKAEEEVARRAIAMANTAPDDDAHRRHVGYFLIGDGLPPLERELGATPTLSERLLRAVRGHPDVVLVGGLAVLTLLALVAVNLLAGLSVARVAWPLILLFTFLPAWDIGISTVNQLVTWLLPPRLLPSLDLRETGVPAEFHTVVVVPTLFLDEGDVQDALQHLAVLRLANRGGAVHFAILSDFADAPSKTMPGDDAIIAAAEAGIRELNSTGEGEVFHLLHRPRRWNPQQQCWMGWERKRGKLTEFNRLLRGGGSDAFCFVSGDVMPLQSARFVITLDSDTMLPPGAAAALIGTMGHPLNRAVHDPVTGRITAGYGILQPRVAVSMESAHGSRFAAILAGQPGVDPYTTAVSDVYQDLYGEGSFTGKGIYEIDAFTRATRGRFPENTLLSHDLIEGNYARAALATSIIVHDDAPAGYVPWSRRLHRWIRGDWQLLPWLGSRVPGPDGPEPNRLSLLSRWKILDNLRRSTVAASQLALILAGWTVLAGSPLRWTLLGLGAIASPWVVALLLAVVRPPRDKSWRAYYSAVGRDAWNSAQQFGLALAFLPHQVWLSLDAIGRTLARLLVTRRNLLEWTTARAAQRADRGTAAEHWRVMGPAVAAITTVALAVLAAGWWRMTSGEDTIATFRLLLISVLPLAIIWALSPWIATRLGPAGNRPSPFDEKLRNKAAEYAARHWQWFERHVTADTHWLAPDNVQFDPTEVVAMRTSPTNIGLQLLATTSAHDLGLLPLDDMVERLERSFDTLDRLPRYRGHFYNWYALDDLRVLQPPYISTVDSGNLAGHLLALHQACLGLAGDAEPGTAARLERLAGRARSLVDAMEFGFLFDQSNRLLSIGYHTDSHTLDAACYDLLASESRLTTFVAVAKGDLPPAAWFRLGRRLVRSEGGQALVSWSGSMFEYLMPLLVMQSFPGTLLNQSSRNAVRTHQAHGAANRVPWGVSESAYNIRDKQLTYQYRAFGVPSLALKRGLARELVIAPYASALAIMLEPEAATRNLMTLEQWGALGPYGFWDSLDFTRPSPGQPFAMVRTAMAHHVGMTLVAITNALHQQVWQRRFHSDAMVQAAELLLQERVPRRLLVARAPRAPHEAPQQAQQAEPPVIRRITKVGSAAPRVAMLGDLPFTLMINDCGAGWTRYNRMAVTRWRDDRTADRFGQFCYLHDTTSGHTWSGAYLPTAVEADTHVVEFAADRATFLRMDGPIETRTEVVVVAADSAEVRRVTLTNHGGDTREIELTSYAEVVMGSLDADAAHPAFANLFVETEWHDWCSAITARRRPRQTGEDAPWCVHLVDAGPNRIGPVSCETDRSRFVGRGRNPRNPAALDHDGPLSGTTGAVLDPVLAIRTRIKLAPRETVSVAFTTLVAATREQAFELADRYHDPHATQRAHDLAWMATQVELRDAGITSAQAAAFEELAGHLIHGGGPLRPPVDELRRNQGDQSRLWNHGISGDLPILLATIRDHEGLPTLAELFAGHRYLRRRGFEFDLVVVAAEPHDYLQQLRQAIIDQMVAASDASFVDQRGGVFIRRRDDFDADDYLMLSATARVRVPCDGRPIGRILRAEQADQPTTVTVAPPIRKTSTPRTGKAATASAANATAIDHHPGEFDDQGNYLVRVSADALPPAPWSNVIANERGGFIVSERGSGCTWAESAYFHRLTPWHNDPVTDPPCDVIYLRDEATKEVWSATPAPIPGDGVHQVRHAPGCSSYTREQEEITTELTMGMPTDDAVKLSLLRITNHGDRPRRISLTCYAEWVLGVRREVTVPHARTWFDPTTGAVMARNRFDAAFSERVAFLAMSETVTSHTGNRTSFLGHQGTLQHPAAMQGDELDGQVGGGLDPCAALRCTLELAPGEQRDVAVLLGSTQGEDAARECVSRLADPLRAREVLDESIAAWEHRLSTITVHTPDEGVNLMLNRWALYQTLSSRVWGRAGPYQSSGAYGFRDQLQDVMALVHAEPHLSREHLLRAAAHQFLEGDVQHWWHPHNGRGVRTRFSDDLAWLPFVADHYVERSGDAAVLDEMVPFLAMRELRPDEHELYEQPRESHERASLYEHCLRALRRACTRGPHGLPLIGIGDWNDGFSRVGVEGRGESVWLAWFLIANCRRFAVHATARGDHAAAAELEAHADHYAAAAQEHAWDGDWYRRAWFDDGTPLGSATNQECRIDSISQSWSVISGAGSPERQQKAMAALRTHLVREDARLIQLLDPPFDDGALDPGYIKGYVPGVRENGAQYTHAALWAVQAMALLGEGDVAWDLYRMINPVTHARNAAEVNVYKVEPYVVAADVYTAEGHLGRGGWTWYTGSASWMYQVGIESLLGFTRRGNRLTIEPCVPAEWPGYRIEYRHGSSSYDINVQQPAAIRSLGAIVTVDGVAMPDAVIPLADDGRQHRVTVAPRDKPA